MKWLILLTCTTVDSPLDGIIAFNNSLAYYRHTFRLVMEISLIYQQCND